MQQSATYLETQVLTASPHRLHLMVVDAALRHARRGAEGIEQRQWDVMFLSLSKARDCLSELIGGLKPEVDPELVEPTKQLFVFVYRNLAKADFERNAALVQDAIRVLEIHRETWLELGQGLVGAPLRPTATAPVSEGPVATGRSWMT